MLFLYSESLSSSFMHVCHAGVMRRVEVLRSLVRYYRDMRFAQVVGVYWMVFSGGDELRKKGSAPKTFSCFSLLILLLCDCYLSLFFPICPLSLSKKSTSLRLNGDFHTSFCRLYKMRIQSQVCKRFPEYESYSDMPFKTILASFAVINENNSFKAWIKYTQYIPMSLEI